MGFGQFFFTAYIQNTLLAPCELLVLTKIRDKQCWLQIGLTVSEDAEGTIPWSSAQDHFYSHAMYLIAGIRELVKCCKWLL